MLNGYTRMLQGCVPNVSPVFSEACCKCVCFRCCVYFTYMLQVFLSRCCICLQWLFKCFQMLCKCFRHVLQMFQLFQTYVASVSSGCCKSKSGVAYVSTVLGRRADRAGRVTGQVGEQAAKRANASSGRASRPDRRASRQGIVRADAQTGDASRWLGNQTVRGVRRRSRRGRPDIGVRPDVRALATPIVLID
jgi:hypothetical protein